MLGLDLISRRRQRFRKYLDYTGRANLSSGHFLLGPLSYRKRLYLLDP